MRQDLLREVLEAREGRRPLVLVTRLHDGRQWVEIEGEQAGAPEAGKPLASGNCAGSEYILASDRCAGSEYIPAPGERIGGGTRRVAPGPQRGRRGLPAPGSSCT